jgi:hypothetical protein
VSELVDISGAIGIATFVRNFIGAEKSSGNNLELPEFSLLTPHGRRRMAAENPRPE